MEQVQPHGGNHSNHLWGWLLAFLFVIIIVIIVLFFLTRQKKPCTNSDQCPSGEVCLGGKCISSEVQGCTTSADCPSDQICQGGTCIVQPSTKCTSTSQCPPGQQCNLTTGQCQSQGGRGIVGSPCQKEGDCNAGLYCSAAQTCQNNTTYSPTDCTSLTQCQLGYFCSSTNQCTSATGNATTGQQCSQSNTCVLTDFCSSALICAPGTAVLPNNVCTSLTQCGSFEGTTYYCNVTNPNGSWTCQNSGLTYQMAPAFTNVYLTNQSLTGSLLYLSVNNNENYQYDTMVLSDPTNMFLNNSSTAQITYSPGTMSVSRTNTGSFAGLMGVSNFGILWVGVTTASILYLVQLNQGGNSLGYVIIDQYGNPLVFNYADPLNTLLGFYDPLHYGTSSGLTGQNPIVIFKLTRSS